MAFPTKLDISIIEDLEELGIEIEQVGTNAEFWVTVEGDRFNVYRGNDDQTDMRGWYVDLVPEGDEGLEEHGPYDSAEDLIQTIFIDNEL